MIGGKGAYLKRITSQLNMRSVQVGKEVEGSSPPSVFVGSWNYPRVYAGPMITPFAGDTRIMDTPESWIPGQISQEEIIGYRLNLVRGKHLVDVADLDHRLVHTLQEISLSSSSIESEAVFEGVPRGTSFTGGEHTPYGPSATLERVDIGNVQWQRDLEKVYYDTDLKAREAILGLHCRGVPFSSIQKAFSVGTMGRGAGRRLVPTRWSITACDTAIANRLLSEVKTYPVIDTYQVREFSSLNNRYVVILLPTPWQYEWTEAFLHILGNEEMVFSDREGFRGKTEYSSVGGCYYSCKMAVLEALQREKKQAGAIVLREANRGYIPLGVFNVRENVRSAMLQAPREHEDLRTALQSTQAGFSLSLPRFIEESAMLRTLLVERQTTLSMFEDTGRNALSSTT
ncbi:MAG: hypothetical protein LUO93_07580 [Methanomicrobiales archaeon]|nr:hypothetical protein [Methanomicrobiales archaeon]